MIDEKRIQELLDKQDIRDVLLRCARGMDRSDWDLVLSCYHDDAVDDHGAYRGGARDYVEWLSKTLRGWVQRTMHTLLNMLIEVEGDVVQAETYVVGYHRYRRDDGRAADWVGGGRYIDRLERRAGEWKIADRLLVWEWVRDDAVEFVWDAFTNDYTWGARDRSDPLYSRRR